MKSILKRGKIYCVGYQIGEFSGWSTGRYGGYDGGWVKLLAVPGEPFVSPVTWIWLENIVTISEVKQDP